MLRYQSFPNILTSVLLLGNACTPTVENPTRWTAQAPAGEQYAQIDTAGTTVLPNGRLLTPRGTTYRVAPHPYGLTLSQDGRNCHQC